jgi:hypothetical protein
VTEEGHGSRDFYFAIYHRSRTCPAVPRRVGQDDIEQPSGFKLQVLDGLVRSCYQRVFSVDVGCRAKKGITGSAYLIVSLRVNTFGSERF